MTEWKVEQFGPDASPRDLADLHELTSKVYLEDLPQLQVSSLAAFLERMAAPTTRIGPRRWWVVRADGSIVATAMAALPEAENRHIAQVNVQVLAQRRRQGAATALLQAVLPALRADGRSVIASQGMREGSTGDDWARARGFHPVHQVVVQSLAVDDGTRARWQVPAPPGFRALHWVGSAPDELLVEYARARTAIHDAPTGEQTYVDPGWTPEQVRRHEANARGSGTVLYVVVAVHEATSAVAGLTELEIRGNEIRRGHQQDTAVLAAFRGRGLGRYIKAELMRWITREIPELVQVTTSSAVDNEHMIRVNRELGYIVDMTLVGLEADLDVLAARVV